MVWHKDKDFNQGRYLDSVAFARDARLDKQPVTHLLNEEVEMKVAELMALLTPHQAAVVRMRADGHRWVDIERVLFDRVTGWQAAYCFRSSIAKLRQGEPTGRWGCREPEKLLALLAVLGVPATALPDGRPTRQRDRAALREAVHVMLGAQITKPEIRIALGISVCTINNLVIEHVQIRIGSKRVHGNPMV